MPSPPESWIDRLAEREEVQPSHFPQQRRELFEILEKIRFEIKIGNKNNLGRIFSNWLLPDDLFSIIHRACFYDFPRRHKKGFEMRASESIANEDIVRSYLISESLYRHIYDLESIGLPQIDFVEAGTGSLALFCIIATLISEKIKATGIEIDATSSIVSRGVVKEKKLQANIRIVNDDAHEYKHSVPIDMLLSETKFPGLMRRGYHEPMATLLPTLARQLHPDHGRIIPEWVTIHAGFASDKVVTDLPERFRWDTRSDLTEIRFPIDRDPNTSLLAISSEVGLYTDEDEVVIRRGESGITAPVFIDNIPPTGYAAVVRYRPNQDCNRVAVFSENSLTSGLPLQIAAPVFQTRRLAHRFREWLSS